jgi:hypothetical protein
MNVKTLLFVSLAILLVVYTAISFTNMKQKADRFKDAVRREVLEPFKQGGDPKTLTEPVLAVAAKNGIVLGTEDVEITEKRPGNLSEMTGLAVQNADSSFSIVVISTRFKLTRFPFHRRFEILVEKTFHHKPAGNNRHSSSGLQGGVDLPAPARGMKSYRDSVNRAVEGRGD